MTFDLQLRRGAIVDILEAKLDGWEEYVSAGTGIELVAVLMSETSENRLTMKPRGQAEGLPKWAVYDGGSVYSKRDETFVYEPMPSSRDKEFLEDTRFKDWEEALAVLDHVKVSRGAPKDWLAKLVVEIQEG